MAMDRNTVFRISNELGEIYFQRNPRMYWLTNIEGFSGLSTAIYDKQFLNQPGSTLTGYAIEARRGTLEGAIFEPMDVTRRQLLRVCAPGVLSKLEVIEPDLTTYLEFYFEKTPEVAPGDVIQPWQAEIFAEYPYWRSERPSGGAVNLLGLEALFQYPKNFSSPAPWMFGSTKRYGNTEVLLEGNMPSPFVLKVTNTGLTNINMLMLRNMVDRSELYMRSDLGFLLGPGAMLVIDTYNQRVYIESRSGIGQVIRLNAYPFMDPESNPQMVLYPGLTPIEFALNDTVGSDNINALGILEVPKGVYSGV